MIVDAPIVRSGDGAQLDAAGVGLQRLDLLGAVRGQAILQVDSRERGGELAKIGGWRPDLGGQLAEAPVSRRDGSLGAGQDQRQPLGIAAARFDMDERGFDHTRPAALRPVPHRAGQVAERQEPLVVGAREPLRRNPADACPACDIHLVTAAEIAAGVENLHVHGKSP